MHVAMCENLASGQGCSSLPSAQKASLTRTSLYLHVQVILLCEMSCLFSSCGIRPNACSYGFLHCHKNAKLLHAVAAATNAVSKVCRQPLQKHFAKPPYFSFIHIYIYLHSHVCHVFDTDYRKSGLMIRCKGGLLWYDLHTTICKNPWGS